MGGAQAGSRRAPFQRRGDSPTPSPICRAGTPANEAEAGTTAVEHEIAAGDERHLSPRAPQPEGGVDVVVQRQPQEVAASGHDELIRQMFAGVTKASRSRSAPLTKVMRPERAGPHSSQTTDSASMFGEM